MSSTLFESCSLSLGDVVVKTLCSNHPVEFGQDHKIVFLYECNKDVIGFVASVVKSKRTDFIFEKSEGVLLAIRYEHRLLRILRQAVIAKVYVNLSAS